MKNLISLCFILFLPVILFGQINKYKSSESDQYNKSKTYPTFTPLNDDEVLSYKNDFIDIEELNQFTSYYDSLRYESFFNRKNYDAKTSNKGYSINASIDCIAKIHKYQIIKYEKRDSISAFLYKDYYFSEAGIWLAYSKDNENSWQYFFTGIKQSHPIYLKWFSSIPFIISENKFQIESCYIKQETVYAHPGPAPKFSLVKDGYKVLFNIEDLVKDSDNDGLTDVIESKFHTSIFYQDSDNDGINDNIDFNPRYKIKKNDITCIYESILNNSIDYNDTKGVNLSCADYELNHTTDSILNYILVSDIDYIQNIHSSSLRLLVFSEKEYDLFKSNFDDDIEQIYVSPLFKVDDEDDLYFLSISYALHGTKYLVRKTADGWNIQIMFSWIS